MPPPFDRRPADRFASIRDQIRALEAEEAELRAGFISGELELQEDEYIITIESKVNQRVDLRAMRERVAEEVWKPFLIEKETACVSVRKRER